MATGDQQDFANRIRGLLPTSWFGTGLTTIGAVGKPQQQTSSETPVLDTVLAGGSYPLAWMYSIFAYGLLQSRIATATGVWLDRISYDFFGTNLPRRGGEVDTQYRGRIYAELFRERQTRHAIVQALVNLTNNKPQIMELWNPGDCGGYDSGVFALDQAGAWGDLSLNAQVFVTAYRPSGGGVPNISGFDSTGGGFDVGAFSFVDLSQITVYATDDEIYQTVANTIAAGVTAWVAIFSNETPTGAPQYYFGNVENSSYLAVGGFFF